jgi:hypothetical protein
MQKQSKSRPASRTFHGLTELPFAGQLCQPDHPAHSDSYPDRRYSTLITRLTWPYSLPFPSPYADHRAYRHQLGCHGQHASRYRPPFGVRPAWRRCPGHSTPSGSPRTCRYTADRSSRQVLPLSLPCHAHHASGRSLLQLRQTSLLTSDWPPEQPPPTLATRQRFLRENRTPLGPDQEVFHTNPALYADARLTHPLDDLPAHLSSTRSVTSAAPLPSGNPAGTTMAQRNESFIA